MQAALLLFALAAPVEELLPLLADLAARGGYGVHYAERGAFLVRDDAGEIRCELWPFTGQFHRLSRTGAIPKGTIAIAHTHPRTAREASAHDAREASRLGIPIIAVSMGTMHVVDSSGAGTPRRGIDWDRFADASRTCSGDQRLAGRRR